MYRFDPQPAELPDRLASPFAHGAPHPLARAAALRLLERLDRTHTPRGQMVGVLIVRAPDGTIGWLEAFSGMLGREWLVPGFAPPLFDVPARAAFWPVGEADLAAFDARLAALDGELAGARAARAVLAAAHAAERDALLAHHRARREARHAARITADPLRLHALDQESRGDEAERRTLRQAHARVADEADARLHVLHAARQALFHAQQHRSNELLPRLHAGYRVPSAAGDARTLTELFAPELPPGGAGDCAAPKLLADAFRHALTPLALAEVWWGPSNGDRQPGSFYPACRRKCGRVLPFMLEGLDVADLPLPGQDAAVAELVVRHEDAHLIVIDKPVGLLSVPGRHARLRDCVQTRAQARWPGAQVVHRLDLDTSGLLLVARTPEAHAAMAAAFARREVDKRYVAVLDGTLAATSGTITLPLRTDVDDRPRQLVDHQHGKPARTDWRRLASEEGRTRVAFWPRTGRTHQLRVHAAAGLGAAIVGDRLYGRHGGDDGPRLMLHAEHLAFSHPASGNRVEIASPAPF
jgi:tRNA pseudouridine32 synthase/23S rRNA pseudouridine746 synthase